MQKNSYQIHEIKRKSNIFPIKTYKSAPEKLFYIGNINSTKPKIAIVGTRKASSEGLILAKSISENLSKLGIIIISGLAIGIDTQAHKGAVECGGITWAVLAHGLDSIYPKSNFNLAKKILENNGALISEYEIGTPPYQSHFIERNKIISLISDAVVIIEAPLRSGAISTALFSLKIGKPVFAIPGNVHSKNYEGTNMLIRRGSRLIRSHKDIIKDLRLDKLYKEMETEKQLKTDIESENQRIIIDIITSNNGSATIDNIIQTTTLNPNNAMSILSEMELMGIIEKINNKYIIKK